MKQKLEEMESANHENFGKVMEILKEYCELKKEKKKNELEEEDKKKKRMRLYKCKCILCYKCITDPPPGMLMLKTDRTNGTNDKQYLLPRNEPGAVLTNLVVNAALLLGVKMMKKLRPVKPSSKSKRSFGPFGIPLSVLPPHLLPYVDDEAVGYVPEFADTVTRLQVAARKEILPMPCAEIDDCFSALYSSTYSSASLHTFVRREEDDAHDISPKKLITYIEERITQMLLLLIWAVLNFVVIDLEMNFTRFVLHSRRITFDYSLKSQEHFVAICHRRRCGYIAAMLELELDAYLNQRFRVFEVL
ncbi:hypothetical protein Tco_0236385 [Tanacetum coccineum]